LLIWYYNINQINKYDLFYILIEKIIIINIDIYAIKKINKNNNDLYINQIIIINLDLSHKIIKYINNNIY
jgi:hypothetical protein